MHTKVFIVTVNRRGLGAYANSVVALRRLEAALPLEDEWFVDTKEDGDDQLVRYTQADARMVLVSRGAVALWRDDQVVRGKLHPDPEAHIGDYVCACVQAIPYEQDIVLPTE